MFDPQPNPFEVPYMVHPMKLSILAVQIVLCWRSTALVMLSEDHTGSAKKPRVCGGSRIACTSFQVAAGSEPSFL